MCGINAIIHYDLYDMKQGQVYSDRYDDASAVWVMVSAILMFFMVSVHVAIGLDKSIYYRTEREYI